MGLFKRSGYWKNVSPTGMIADLVTVWKQSAQNRWWIGCVSAACTFAVFSLMVAQGGSAPHLSPKVTYITSWEAGRSDEEIMASNIAHQKLKDQMLAEKAERDEKVKGIYRTLGRMSGLDVEKIERDAEMERAAKRKVERDAIAARRGTPASE